jgi:hypothetical protein
MHCIWTKYIIRVNIARDVFFFIQMFCNRVFQFWTVYFPTFSLIPRSMMIHPVVLAKLYHHRASGPFQNEQCVIYFHENSLPETSIKSHFQSGYRICFQNIFTFDSIWIETMLCMLGYLRHKHVFSRRICGRSIFMYVHISYSITWY